MQQTVQATGQSVFSADVSASVFAALLLCYLMQALIAFSRARESIVANGQGHQVTLAYVVRNYDGGLPNVWTFFVLAIFTPVLLNGLGNVLPFLDESDPPHPDPWSAALYFGCLAAIGVIITLELSYVHNLRTSAKEWIPMLVVAIALDIITLLVFFNFVGHPQAWERRLDFLTRSIMIAATCFALLSSFLILIYARAAGALAGGQVPLSAGSSAPPNPSASAGPGSGQRERSDKPVPPKNRAGNWWSAGPG